MSKWTVSYPFVRSIEYESGPLRYPKLGVKLVLEGSSLVELVHEVEAESTLSTEDVITLSRQQVSVVLDLLDYLNGQAPVVRTVTVTPPGRKGQLATGLQHIHGTARIVHGVHLPKQSALRSPGRLRVWLRLMIESRPPATAVDAIRNYYMVYEDLRGRPNKGDPNEALKFVRDFVSHSRVISPRLVTFLQHELKTNASEFRFDHNAPDHQRLVEKYREKARVLLDAEIQKKL